MGKERHQNHAEGGKGKRQKHWVTDLASQFNLFSRTIQLILPGKTSYFGRQNNLYSNAPKIALLNTSQVIYRNEVNCSIEMT